MKTKKLLYIMLLGCLISLFGVKSQVEAKVIYTTDAKVNAAAEKIINSCTTEKMTKNQKLHAVYIYLVKHMKYSWHTGRARIKVTSKDIKDTKAKAKELKKENKLVYSAKFRGKYKNVLSLQGTCYGISKVFCILANHMGYRADVVHGRYFNGGHSVNHYWNYIVIDGKKRYFDVEIAYRHWHRHHSMKELDNYYKKSKKNRFWRKHYRG